MKTRFLSLFLFLAPLGAMAAGTVHAETHRKAPYPVVKIETERLPDLNVPRIGHTALYTPGGELLVVGGHTSGFVPTPTAEYFSDGKWHLLNTVYPHDDGISLLLSSGQVLVAGSHEKPLGIGQAFPVEKYDPVSHTFEGFACLDRARTLLSALELDSGRVVVAGNWYAPDAIEMFDGQRTFFPFKSVSQERSFPYMFRRGRDNAMIFSGCDIRGNSFDTIFVDQLYGEPFCPQLFREWKPIRVYEDATAAQVSDHRGEVYSYLFTVVRSDGQMGIAQARDSVFSLLPTACPLPMHTPTGDSLYYQSQVHADTLRGRAYLLARDEAWRCYVVTIDYREATEEHPAPLTLYYTDPMPDCGFYSPVLLTPEGDLLLLGGRHNTNYQVYASVVRLRLNGDVGTSSTGTGWIRWVCLVLALALLAGSALYFNQRRNKKPANQDEEAKAEPSIEEEPTEEQAPLTTAESEVELMKRIHHLIADEKMYLNPDLKVPDIAHLLGVHRNYVSSVVNSQESCTVSTYVNRFRVEHAKQLLRNRPDTKLSTVASESGFATEQSFFRAFKFFLDMTPREWVTQL
ncbi:MAG: helix-turn-helix transcriptional regulator [Bacteroidaceae bacterium]|nr:helix-turn-helix transcriptional regulator [Bacteroidaceae bacterium]